jgi:lipid II:glycine glycyltransferase (peptidoglycan interpeptide bridge formation enzyme)
MGKYRIIKEIDREKWSEFVYNHPYGNIFQTPEMFDVFKETKKNEPIVFAVINIEINKIIGVLVSVIQKEYSGIIGSFTARSIIWGGPLIINSNEEVNKILINYYNKNIKRKAIYSQFRNLWNQESNLKYFESNGCKYEEHLNILIDLKKSEDELWKDVYSKRRNEIRRAKKEGTTVKELKDEHELKESYNILKEVYARASLPLHEWSMFEVAYKILFPKNMIKFFGAFYKNKIIGTIVILCYKDRIYDWYAGSHKEFYNKYPNDLLPWEVFLWGKRNGYKIFDFGGAGKPGQPYGVRDYKKKFGGVFVNFGRFEKIHKPFMMKIGKLGLKIWQKIK